MLREFLAGHGTRSSKTIAARGGRQWRLLLLGVVQALFAHGSDHLGCDTCIQ